MGKRFDAEGLTEEQKAGHKQQRRVIRGIPREVVGGMMSTIALAD